jgi:hypothetical protein
MRAGSWMTRRRAAGRARCAGGISVDPGTGGGMARFKRALSMSVRTGAFWFAGRAVDGIGSEICTGGACGAFPTCVGTVTGETPVLRLEGVTGENFLEVGIGRIGRRPPGTNIPVAVTRAP